jgi:HSP20 family protein
MNNKLDKYPFTFSSLDRDEFLTPFDRIFDEFFTATSPGFTKDFGVDFFQKGSYPRVNVVEYKDTVSIEAEIPGLSREDVSVEIQKNTLTISGTKNTPTEFSKEEKGTYIVRELKRSSFKRSFSLGDNIDKNTIDAQFNNGILVVTLKKLIPTQPEVRKIAVK